VKELEPTETGIVSPFERVVQLRRPYMGLLKMLGVAVGVAVLGPIALAAIIPGGSLNNMCGIDGYCDDDD
tara:strand:- start:5270 stop:5479 length:210 start_codon:yes stop_codon:yes gene_type:complete